MKKKLIIIFITLIALCITFVSIAASVKIEYNYNLSVETPSFSINNDSTLTTSTSNNSYTIDTSASYVDILTISSDTYTVLEKQLISSVSGLDSTTTKVFPNTIVYTKDSNTYTVTYHNEYVKSLEGLKTINYSKFYNNIFSYSKNTNNLSLRIIFIDSFKIDEEVTIKAPVSITILKNLTLSSNLNIINSYAGNYDITLFDSSINTDNSSKIIINRENANYKYDTNEVIELNNSISIDSAKNFILEYIPNYLNQDIYLPKTFLSSNINYDYYVLDSDNAEHSFSGSLTEVNDYITKNKLSVKVNVTKGNTSESVQKEVIVGNNAEALNLILTEELSSTNNQLNYDLLMLLQSLNITCDIKFSKGTNFDIVINNSVVTSDTTISYDKTNNYYKLADIKVCSIIIRRTSIDSSSFTLNLNGEDITIYLSGATKPEILDYIKSYIHAYIVTSDNIPYDILNIKDDILYIGTTSLSISTADLFTDFKLSIIDTSGNAFTSYTKPTDSTILVDSSAIFTTLSLNYYDGEELLFSTPIKKSLNSNSGDDTGFESNNPFDSIFSSSTNWLTNNTFEMPSNSNYSGIYAKINITKINGVAYDTTYTQSISVRGTTYNAYTHKMIRVTGAGTTASNDSSYTKNINFAIDYDYVPNFDSIIQVECLLYNNDAGGEITATHIYTFTIPGILKCGNNTDGQTTTPFVFTSSTLYSDVLLYFKTNSNTGYFVDIDSNTSYILANAKYASEISISGESESIDTNGIEYFTYTTSITIEDYTITDLTAFTYLEDSSLVNLKLDNDNITSSILGTNLYNIRLNNLSLKDNDLSGISSFKGLFFRTITEINLNSSKLTTISGIDSLVNLVSLYIESNNIKNFEPIKNLDYLTDVYLYNNTIDENNYYGTDGLVSEVVYFWVLKTNSTTIHKGLEDTNNYTLNESNDYNSMLLYLNAISIPTKLSSYEYEDLVTNLNANDIYIEADLRSSGSIIAKYSLDSITLYREFYVEVIS